MFEISLEESITQVYVRKNQNMYKNSIKIILFWFQDKTNQINYSNWIICVKVSGL